MITEPHYVSFLLWEVTTILTYIVSNLSFLPIKCPSSITPLLDKCCIMNNNVFDVSHETFSKSQHRVNIRFIMLYSIAVFFLGNKYNQLDPLTYPITSLYIIIPPLSALIMSYMSNVKGLQTSCSRTSIKKWPVISWIIYITVALIALTTYGYNIYIIYIVEGIEALINYVTLITFIALFELVLYKLYDPSYIIHIHHLFIGTMGATLYQANSPIIIPFAFALYGVGIEGASNYGFPDIFEN